MKLTALATAAAVSLSALAMPAAAEEVRVPVSFADLDIATQGGSEILANRVKVAVATACERPASRDLKLNAKWQQCRESALDNAAEQLSRQGVVADAGSALASL